MVPAESFHLRGTSTKIPSRGLGTFQVDPKAYPIGSVKDSVRHALQVGYRHIDAALGYGWGSVERDVGQAVKESGIPREDIFIVTKLHNTFHKPQDVAVGMAMSLKNLGMDYVDLYLMHFSYAYVTTDHYGTQRREDGKPVIDVSLSKAYDQTWKAMEALVHEGKAKLIGVSNFSTPKLKRLLDAATIPPVVNQVELHPYFPQKGLVRFCRDNDIHITAHCPLGGNVVPVLRGRTGPGPLEDPTIMEIATKYQKTPAQVILSHLIALGVSVIPKSNNLKRIEENFDVLFELESVDFEKIDQLMGKEGEKGVRSLEMRDYLGFDNFNEEVEEP